MLPSFGASLIFLVVPLITLLPIQRCGAADGNTTTTDLYYKQCSTSGNFSNNSPYQLNLVQLLTTLQSKAINNSGYFNGTAGLAPDAVFGLVMCQADIPWPDQCDSCLKAATAGVSAACPSSKNGSAGNPGCLIRYSDTPIAGIPNDDIAFDTLNHAANVLQIVPFEVTRRDLFKALAAAASVAPMLLASGNRTYNSSHTLYGLAQCSRDLQGDDCSKCITSLVTNVPIKVKWSEGVSVTGLSCYIRYDLTPFGIYGPGTSTISGAPQIMMQKGSHRSAIVVAVVVISIVIPLVAVMAYCLWKSRTMNKQQLAVLKRFTQKEISNATDNFNQSNFLGQGGFGRVYKGSLLIDGTRQEIAVKKFILTKQAHDTANEKQLAAVQLQNELELLIKVRHDNLVRLIGYCNENEVLILCFEFLSNRSLDLHIFPERSDTGNQAGVQTAEARSPANHGTAETTYYSAPVKFSGCRTLNWPQRKEVIRGICEGLYYLHEKSGSKKIVHMDIKPQNILLDKNMKPKISDFGLSRLFGENQTHKTTKEVIGSIPYMAPEYINKQEIGPKSDIYSLGVLLLEIITGQHCGHQIPLADARQKFKEGKFNELKDPSLADDCLDEEVKKYVLIALKCVERESTARPSARAVNNWINTEAAHLNVKLE